jgi:hypothetical protein
MSIWNCLFNLWAEQPQRSHSFNTQRSHSFNTQRSHSVAGDNVLAALTTKPKTFIYRHIIAFNECLSFMSSYMETKLLKWLKWDEL